jgi:hypothetical protein
MRTRTILAAAAAPAALAAVLLGTAGQASAAVAAPTQATLTASVQKSVTYKANTHQHGVADTTNVGGGATLNNDPGPYPYGPIGPVWAFDNMERQFTATSNGDGTWNVLETVTGSYSAVANPIDASAWTGNGPVSGSVQYTVRSNHAPGNLPAQLDSAGGAQFHSSDIVQMWFGDGASITSSSGYHFEYKGIPGATDGPGGLYIQQ